MSSSQKNENNGAKAVVSEDIEESKATHVDDVTLHDGSTKTA
jgi:hypothetical protein